ncbi:Protein MB21D2 [Exaiptasia diaphana]|nr:Protein MB21D2 [Exaiptasia diaphana]
MAEANAKFGRDLWEMSSFPNGVPKTPWNFNTYVMYAVIKHILRGSFKGEIDAVLQSGCQTSVLLGMANYFQLEECFLSNQEYAEPLRVGSVAEDVVIVQIFRQACEDAPEEENMGVLNEFPGQARLTPPPNIEHSSVPGLRTLCVEDKDGLTVISSEALVNELYYLLTINTAITNVVKCQQSQTSNNEDDTNVSAYSKSLQYVGQAGPAVHIVTCVVTGTSNKRHLFLTEDVSISVPCQAWPTCALNWTVRDRSSGWPSKELIDKVIEDGCHLVPKYDPSGRKEVSNDPELEDETPMTSWRYSFSLSEKTLMNSINDDQRMCYLIFKYLFAQFVKLQSVITTYCVKTLFLWELETVPHDQWCYSQIGDRVKDLVENLRICINNKYCQHYFIEGCNTLNQMDDKSRQVTLENGFRMLDEEMAEGPNFETGILEVTSDFPFNFMTTYKSFYPTNVWLESLSAQMNGTIDPSKEVPSAQNILDFLDNTKVHPIQMPEILIYLVLAEKLYGQPLSLPTSLLDQEKVAVLVKFLKRSTTEAKFKERI